MRYSHRRQQSLQCEGLAASTSNDVVRSQRRQAVRAETLGMGNDACRRRTLRAYNPAFLIAQFMRVGHGGLYDTTGSEMSR